MKKAISLIVIVALVVAGMMFWWGNIHNANAPGAMESGSIDSSLAARPSSLVGYTLPSGWQEKPCADDNHTYVIPTGATLDCNADPKAPISLLVDPRDTKDCQHVTAPNGVLSHVCKTIFIDGHKTVQASTEYPKSDLYPKAETVSDFFVDTGKGVVQIEYVYGAKGSNTYQTGFDQLVQTVKVK